MSEKKVEVRVKLKVKDVEIELTQAEVLELQGMLNGLFPQEPIIIEKHVPYPQPWVLPYQPYPRSPYYWKYIPDNTPTITWSGSGANEQALY